MDWIPEDFGENAPEMPKDEDEESTESTESSSASAETAEDAGSDAALRFSNKRRV
jgi:hypothetical protein